MPSSTWIFEAETCSGPLTVPPRIEAWLRGFGAKEVPGRIACLDCGDAGLGMRAHGTQCARGRSGAATEAKRGQKDLPRSLCAVQVAPIRKFRADSEYVQSVATLGNQTRRARIYEKKTLLYF